MNLTGLAYRKNAAEAAGGLGLLIALFDALASNVRSAAEAQRRNDIQARCEAVRRALLIIGHLEDWVSRGPGGDLAKMLVTFYSSLRRKLVEAEGKGSADLLEKAMSSVLEVRASWQSIELRTEKSGPEILRPERRIPPGYPEPRVESRAGSWSA